MPPNSFGSKMTPTESKQEGDPVKKTIFILSGNVPQRWLAKLRPAFLLIAFLAAALAGCGNKQTAASATTASQPSATASVMPTMPATNSASEAQAPNASSVSGTVLETMDAGGYTYLKLRTSSGEIWAAVPQTKTKAGTQVTLVGTMQMEKFESKTLKRTFDHIVFGQIGQPGASMPIAPAASAMPAAGNPNPHAGTMPAANAPKVDLANIKVEKATGSDAKTIAEIWGQKSLKDAPVTVRGKVVKFLPGIMGKNWIHIRDGSGSNETGNNDLTVTTDDMTAVGDVIVVKGTVHRDKDFGAGYAYPVIIEGAKLSK